MYIYGLNTFDVSTGAFTISMTAVILPVILLMRKRNVERKTWISAVLVLAGIAVSYISKIGKISVYGFLIMIAGCILRAVYIIRLNDYAKKYDPIAVSTLISALVGIYAYFVVAFAQTLNIFAQRRTTPASATVIYSLEIIFSLIWGMTMPSNLVTPVSPDVYMLIGVVFILLGNLTDVSDFSRIFKRKEAQRIDS